MSYDVDSSWPAAGWRLSLGQIEDQGSYGFTLTDGDGTRHALVHGFFGGIKKAKQALAEMGKNTSFGELGDPRAVAETLGKKTTINPNSFFTANNGSVDIRLDVQGDYVTLNNINAAAFVLAHELGHRTKKLLSDGNDPIGVISTINNGAVYNACFGETPFTKGPPP